MGLISKITNGECAKCEKLVKRDKLTPVQFDGKIRYLCPECSWDLEKWFHTMPLQFGDEQKAVKVVENPNIQT